MGCSGDQINIPQIHARDGVPDAIGMWRAALCIASARVFAVLFVCLFVYSVAKLFVGFFIVICHSVDYSPLMPHPSFSFVPLLSGEDGPRGCGVQLGDVPDPAVWLRVVPASALHAGVHGVPVYASVHISTGGCCVVSFFLFYMCC